MIKPLKGKICGKIVSEEITTDSGIKIVKDIRRKEIPSKLKVIAVGAKTEGKNGLNPPAIPNDTAYFKRHTSQSIGKDYTFIKFEDVIAIERNKELKAVFDMVIVDIIYADKESSIFIPDTIKKRSGSFVGKVVSIGPEYKHNLKVGENIYFIRDEGYKIEYNLKEYTVLKERWVAGKSEDK